MGRGQANGSLSKGKYQNAALHRRLEHFFGLEIITLSQSAIRESEFVKSKILSSFGQSLRNGSRA